MENRQKPGNDLSDQLSKVSDLQKRLIDQLNSIENTINRFGQSFEPQNDKLSALVKKTGEQQQIVKNINELKGYLSDLYYSLNTESRISGTIDSSIDQNFDEYIESMNQIISTRQKLASYKFNDAQNSSERLKLQLVIGVSKMMNYFSELVDHATTAIPHEIFVVEKNVPTINGENYLKDSFYPTDMFILNRIKSISEIFRVIGKEEHKEKYIQTRLNMLNTSLQPFMASSRVRILSPGPFNIIDLPRYQKCSHPIHLLIFCFRYHFAREIVFSKYIFGDSYMPIFERIIRPVFLDIEKTIRALKQPIQSHTDILLDLDLLGTLSDFMDRIAKDQIEYIQEISLLASEFKDTIIKIFGQFISCIEHHDPSANTPNGTVSAITSNVLHFLISLTQYEKSVLLVSQYELHTFIPAVIDKLTQNIIEKSQRYNDKALGNLYLMNNAHYIYTTIQNCDYISKISVEQRNKLETVIQKSQDEYIKLTWNNVFISLNPDPNFGEYKSGSPLTSKQKTIIKEKFKQFHDRINELTQKHSHYYLKNQKLMSPIANEAKRKVSSIYHPFWVRFKDSQFANRPEKYIQFLPTTLEDLIGRLYGLRK